MDQDDLEELYQEVILDHYKNPRCKGGIDNPSASMEAYNPLCGDRVLVQIQTSGNSVDAVSFDGAGCSISQAAASLMAELCAGKTIAEVKELAATFKKMILEDVDQEALASLGDAAVLRGIKKFPARYRCALLAWQAMTDALDEGSSA